MSKAIYEAPQWKDESKMERPTVTVGPEFDALTQAVANGWITESEATAKLKKEEPVILQQLSQSGFKFGKENDRGVIMPDDVSPI